MAIAQDSILNTIKQMLGVDSEYTNFDMAIQNHINTAINVLAQIGAIDDGYCITGYSETFGDMLGEKLSVAQMVRTYIYEKVKLMFDPPLSSSLIDVSEKHIAELEFRIKVQLDNTGEETDGVDDSE